MASNLQDEIPPYNANASGDQVVNIYGFGKPSLTTRLRRVEKVVPFERSGSDVFSSAGTSSVASSAVNSGMVDLTSSAVVKVGSVPPSGITGQFTATADTSSISWFWDGTNGSTPLVVHRADGTYFAIPLGSITITGLAANTTYYFLPFWSVFSACAVGWVPGTTGTPKIAFVASDTTNVASAQFYLAQQQQQNREQLTGGFMTYSTTASGSSSGGGGGGGSAGGCVMAGTDIEPIGDYGDMNVDIRPETQWHYIRCENLLSLNGTADHPIYACQPADVAAFNVLLQSPDETALEPFKLELQSLVDGMYIGTSKGASLMTTHTSFIRTCTKRCVHLLRGHLFWANGILSHNKFSPP